MFSPESIEMMSSWNTCFIFFLLLSLFALLVSSMIRDMICFIVKSVKSLLRGITGKKGEASDEDTDTEH